jgi:uncharacterized membrane protein
MHLKYYFYILIYYIVLTLAKTYQHSCNEYVFCGGLTTIINPASTLAIAAYVFAGSSCRVLNGHGVLPEGARYGRIAWTAGGGIYFLGTWVRERPGMVTRWMGSVRVV